eukprot:PhM_4_TR13121/c0_g1_i1/m.69350
MSDCLNELDAVLFSEARAVRKKLECERVALRSHAEKERTVTYQLERTRALLSDLEGEDNASELHKQRATKQKELDGINRRNVFAFAGPAQRNHPMKPFAPPPRPHDTQTENTMNPTWKAHQAMVTASELATAQVRGHFRSLENLYAIYIRLLADVALSSSRELGELLGEQRAAAIIRVNRLEKRPVSYAAMFASVGMPQRPEAVRADILQYFPPPVTGSSPRPPPLSTQPMARPHPSTRHRARIVQPEDANRSEAWFADAAAQFEREDEVRRLRECADARVYRHVCGPIEAAKRRRFEIEERRRMRRHEAEREEAKLRLAMERRPEPCCCLNQLVDDAQRLNILQAQVSYWEEQCKAIVAPPPGTFPF